MIKYAVVLVSLTLTLTACSSAKVDPNDPDAREVQTKDSKIVDTPDNELFEKGKDYFDRGYYSTAKEAFTSLRDSYPFSPYTEIAQIRLAEIEFEKEKFDAAALLFIEVLKKYPASGQREYLMMQIGRSYHLAYRGTGRDIEPIRKALDNYEAALRAYPDGKYSEQIRQYAREAGQSLVEHERTIMEFYRRQGNETAFMARRTVFDEKWQPLLDGLNQQNKEEGGETQEAKTPSKPSIIESRRKQPDARETQPDKNESRPEDQPEDAKAPFESLL